MSKMYILIGVPGCGKSTWCKENIDEKTVVVCKDAFRSMLRIDYEYNLRYEPIVHDLQTAAIASAVMNGLDIIVDETNIKKHKRDVLKKLVPTIFNQGCYTGYDIIYVVFKNTDTLDRRMNEPRGYTREQWDEVIKGMIASMEWPTENECDELLTI